MAVQLQRNPDGTITLRHETQTWNPVKGGMDIEIHGEIRMSVAEWRPTIADLLDMTDDDSGIVGKGRV